MQVNILHTGIKPELLLNAMQRRSSVRNFDKTLGVPDNKLEVLLECLRQSPSSMNIQPWKFIVVKDKKIRKELEKYSIQQSQLTDASHLVILCSLKNVDTHYINSLISCENIRMKKLNPRWKIGVPMPFLS
jgi:nitroreductase